MGALQPSAREHRLRCERASAESFPGASINCARRETDVKRVMVVGCWQLRWWEVECSRWLMFWVGGGKKREGRG